MHANACESLLPFLYPGANVLDVGSGSGYLTHVLAELVQPGGKVVGVEHIQALAKLGRTNTGKSAGEGSCWVVGGLRMLLLMAERAGRGEVGRMGSMLYMLALRQRGSIRNWLIN